MRSSLLIMYFSLTSATSWQRSLFTLHNNSNVDIDMHNVLQKYKMDENSKNINMALIQKDLNNKVSNE